MHVSVHRVTELCVQELHNNGTRWLEITLSTQDGEPVTITAFHADHQAESLPLTVAPAEDVSTLAVAA